MSLGRSGPLRVGVLPPGSSFVPLLAEDLLAALELGLADAGVPAELVAEFADHNADPKVVAPKAQQLLVGQRCACVVAPLNVSLMERLAPNFQFRNSPLLALTLGEDPLFDTARNPCLFVHSHQLWRAAWMCGYLGVRRFGPRAAMLLGLHDGGYGLAFAFQLGLEAAGGEVAHVAVTHRHSRRDDPSDDIAAALRATPDFVWAAYSGLEAISFLQAYARRPGLAALPIIGLSPLVEDHVRAGVGAAAAGLHIVTPGPSSADQHALTLALTKALTRRPHPYVVLAYESARLLGLAAGRVAGGQADLPAALRDVAFDSARGAVRFDDGVERPIPFCLRRMTADGETVDDVDGVPALDEQCGAARRNLVKQGWVNPYLCA